MAHHCKGCVLGKKEIPSTVWTGEKRLQQTKQRQATVELYSEAESLHGDVCQNRFRKLPPKWLARLMGDAMPDEAPADTASSMN